MSDTGTSGHTAGDLRRTIEQAEARLARLDRGSAAHRELRRQIARASARLRAHEAGARQRAGHVRDLRLAYVALGGIVAFAGWGSWTMSIGVAVAVAGVWCADRLPGRFYR